MDIKDRIKAWEDEINKIKNDIMKNKKISKKIKTIIKEFDFLEVYKYIKSNLFNRYDASIEELISDAINSLQHCQSEKEDCILYGRFIVMRFADTLKLIYAVEHKDSKGNFKKCPDDK
jgi:hypothetical protein